MDLTKERIVISGGAGFSGRHLQEQLRSQGVPAQNLGQLWLVLLRSMIRKDEKEGPGRYPQHLLIWVGGFVMSSVLVLLISPYFLNSLVVYQWSPEIGDHVFKDGYVHRQREEGWATTRYGPLGLNHPVASASGVPTVLIWGDSFVEAHQVSDDQKAASQVTDALSQDRTEGITAVGVGYSYWGVSDYYFNIPAYERRFHPICHFIVLAEHGIADMCPDGKCFLDTPTYQFVRRARVNVRQNQIVEFLRKWRLQEIIRVPWLVVKNLSKDVRHMRFFPGGVGSYDPPQARCSRVRAWFEDTDPNDMVAGWTHAITMLKGITKTQIVLVSVPEVPSLQNGDISCTDPQSRWNERLGRLCQEQGLGYINMAETLIEDYRVSGRLSRGFHNGVPGSGHLNARGQYLLSREICAYLREHFGDCRQVSCGIHQD